MTAPAGHPDPIYAGFARPFERNPTTRVPNQPHRGGKLSPFTFLLANRFLLTSAILHIAPHIKLTFYFHTAFTEWESYWGKMKHWFGHGPNELIELESPCKPQLNDDNLCLFSLVFFPPSPGKPPPAARSMSMQACFIGFKTCLCTQLLPFMRIQSSFRFPLSGFCMSTNKLSHSQIFPHILKIICACPAFIMLHLHLILPIWFAILHAGCRNKC